MLYKYKYYILNSHLQKLIVIFIYNLVNIYIKIKKKSY